MATLAIQGMQWGDEGKGKITDFFAQKADIVVRSQGGNNAGHSIQRDGVRYALRLLPSGIFNENAVNVLADGMVINLECLVGEIANLEKAGIKKYNLLISNRATLLLPYHADIDKAREAALGDSRIGTTRNGIGPCYEDKAARLSLRVGDLLNGEKDLKARIEAILRIKNIELGAFGQEGYSVKDIYDLLMRDLAVIKPYITDTTVYLNKAYKEGKNIFFEGAQGAMLCLNYGTFPYVTSSSPLVTAIPNNTGLPLRCVNKVLGIMKAYTTRVGDGPFPSEFDDEVAHTIREVAHEYGTVTKRPRRIGWLDIPQLRYVKNISGIDHIAIMLLDVLGSVDEIKVVTKYVKDGEEIDYVPSSIPQYKGLSVETITLPSWKCDISSCKSYDELPKEAKDYIETIEKLLETPISIISVSPEKDATIIREELF